MKKREINCDEKLQKLFNNKKRISMFDIAKYMGKHLLGNPIKSIHSKKYIDTKSERSNSANGNTWCFGQWKRMESRSGMDIDDKNFCHHLANPNTDEGKSKF